LNDVSYECYPPTPNAEPVGHPPRHVQSPAGVHRAPENRVDLTTDADGAGEASATVPFTLDDAAPQSIAPVSRRRSAEHGRRDRIGLHEHGDVRYPARCRG
jgi:hypothetical protein